MAVISGRQLTRIVEIRGMAESLIEYANAAVTAAESGMEPEAMRHLQYVIQMALQVVEQDGDRADESNEETPKPSEVTTACVNDANALRAIGRANKARREEIEAAAAERLAETITTTDLEEELLDQFTQLQYAVTSLEDRFVKNDAEINRAISSMASHIYDLKTALKEHAEEICSLRSRIDKRSQLSDRKISLEDLETKFQQRLKTLVEDVAIAQMTPDLSGIHSRLRILEERFSLNKSRWERLRDWWCER